VRERETRDWSGERSPPQHCSRCPGGDVTQR